MKKIIIGTIFSLFLVNIANAQYSAQKDAANLIIVKVVSEYKMGDEEHERNINNLRENNVFNDKLQRMLNELSNNRSKNSKNQRILKVLENAGKEIDNILGIR